MDIAGHLDWWEHVLESLAQCPMTFDSLDQEVKLPNGAKEEKLLEFHRPTYRNLFTRVINYVNYNGHIQEQEFSLGSKIHQSIILEPDGPFELLVNGEREKIKKRTAIIGDFTDKQLLGLLDEKIIEGNICCISKGNHAIRLGYKDSQWILYDPNYDHTSVKKIKFVTRSKKELVKELIKVMGNSLAIVVSSLNTELVDFNKYKEVIEQKPLELLRTPVAFAKFLDVSNLDHLTFLLKKAQLDPELRRHILNNFKEAPAEFLSRRLCKVRTYSRNS